MLQAQKQNLRNSDKNKAAKEQAARMHYKNDSINVIREGINLVRLLKF
ncbi:hypothetical protein GPC19245_10220 [Enterobacter asburiae]